jgi:peptide/nickel transport system ATP-binding protein
MAATPILELQQVSKAFRQRRRSSSRNDGRQPLMAVEGVDLAVPEREIFGLVGESGAGKSTLGEIIVGLQTPTSGAVRYRGRNIGTLPRKDRRAFRREAQMVFQDPYATLDPHFTSYQSVVEPAVIAGVRGASRRLELVRQAISRCELDPTDRLLAALPHQLSGGQRQRIAIARAIVMEPRLLVADEPVSMLDASVRSGILNLFLHLRDSLGLSIVYVSHDLPSVRYLCDRVAIMYAGRILEAGDADEVIERARHPYTRELLESVPNPDGGEIDEEFVDVGQEEARPTDTTSCRFMFRCPYADAECHPEPELSQQGAAHFVRCVHPVTAPVWDQLADR